MLFLPACFHLESGISLCEERAWRAWLTCKNNSRCNQLYLDLLKRCDNLAQEDIRISK